MQFNKKIKECALSFRAKNKKVTLKDLVVEAPTSGVVVGITRTALGTTTVTTVTLTTTTSTTRTGF